MCCHVLLCLSDPRKLSVKEDGRHLVGECDEPAWNPLMSMSDTGPTNPVLKCKYSAQCIGCYMMCHVCIAWHIVTNCGNAPSWYVPRPAAGKRSNSRVLFQDSVTPIFVYMLGIYAGVPQLRCLGQCQN